MLLWYHVHQKISILVHTWESFTSSNIINKKYILEGVHLWRKVSSICSKCTILELV